MPVPLIQSYHFVATKYGRELLLDIGRVEKLKNYVLDSTKHQLSFYDILFLEEGKGSFFLDGQRIPLKPGTVIFTSPGQVRQWKIEKPISGYTVFFEKDFLNLFFTDELFLYRFQFFHQYQKPTFVVPPKEELTLCLGLVDQIEKEMTHLQSDSSHFLRALLYQLLVILNRAYSKAYNLQQSTYIHPQFFKFRSLLEKNFITHHRVVDFVQLLHISQSRLNQICKQHTGFSAQQLIHQKQASEIKRRLSLSDDTISDIAYAFNFSDPSNFNRFFKKVSGLSPQQYRNNQ